MSAYEEMMRLGQLGPETFKLFVWHLPSVARRHGFPPPDGAATWSPDVCREWVQEFFTTKGTEVAMKLFLTATSESSFIRLARKAMENALKDQAKATTAGKLRSRMRTLLSKEPDFVDATAQYAGDPAWSLDELGDGIYGGDWHDLLNAPGLKQVGKIVALNSAGPTSSENAAKLVGAARLILRFAGGAVRDQVLATLLVHLFELDAPDFFLVRDDDVPASEIARDLTREERHEAALAAEKLIMALTPDEGRALLVLDQPRAVAELHLPHIKDLDTFFDDLSAKLRTLIDDSVGLPPGTLDYVNDWYLKLPDS